MESGHCLCISHRLFVTLVVGVGTSNTVLPNPILTPLLTALCFLDEPPELAIWFFPFLVWSFRSGRCGVFFWPVAGRGYKVNACAGRAHNL